MANGKNKFQSREIRSLVNHILFYDWDPMGIRDFPEARNQYEAYAGKIYVMLESLEIGKGEIAQYLYEVAIGRMASEPSPALWANCLAVADKLFELRPLINLH